MFLQVLENGQLIGPAHMGTKKFAGQGAGRYSHWAGFVYVSATDNSDARENGRICTVLATLKWPLWTYLVGGVLALVGLVGVVGAFVRK